MKKVLLVCLIVLGISTLSKAQGGGGRPQQTPDQQLATLKTQVGDLKLTADQETKVMAIYKAAAASQDSVTKAGGDRTAMMPIRTATTAKLKAVLTPDQFAKIPARGGRGGGGAGGGGGTPPPPTR